MGQNLSDFCSLISSYPDQPLSLMLHSNLSCIHINGEVDLGSVNYAIVKNADKVVEWDNYSIEYQGSNGEMINNQRARLIIKPKLPGKGLIVYEWGYYLGMIKNYSPHDKAGEFVFANRISERGE
jgi:hypothetical protein